MSDLQTIAYWDQLTTLDELLPESTKDVLPVERERPNVSKQVEAVFAKILAGDYKGADLKKLPNKGNGAVDLYYARINDSERLIFLSIPYQDKTGATKHSLVLVDYIKNHNFNSSRFLQPKTLANFLGKNAEEIVAELHAKGEAAFIDAADDDRERLGRAENARVQFKRRSYLQGKFVELSELQDVVVNAHELPLLVTGPGGTGKTGILLRRILKHEAAFAGEDPADVPPITCIVKNAHLAKKLRDELAAHPWSKSPPPKHARTFLR